jgi:excisionase family DNA binding protein
MLKRAATALLPERSLEDEHSIFDFGEAFMVAIREAVREEINAAGNGHRSLLTPEELAEKLRIPVTWVYEQSRQKKIPTHRVGRCAR